jgi:tetratricopeptide (TPR) repeat protein
LVLQAWSDYAGARALLEKALRSAEQNFEPEHPTTAVRYFHLGAVYAQTGQIEEALRLVEKACAVYRSQPGEEHPHTVHCKRHLDDLQSHR